MDTVKFIRLGFRERILRTKQDAGGITYEVVDPKPGVYFILKIRATGKILFTGPFARKYQQTVHSILLRLSEVEILAIKTYY